MSTLGQQPHVLFVNSGVQFIDQSFVIDPLYPDAAFIRAKVGGPLREVMRESSGHYVYRPTEESPAEWVRPEYFFSLQHSLHYLQNHWLPIPFLHSTTQSEGLRPTNWARAFLTESPTVPQGWAITFAFDTRVSCHENMTQPSLSDIQQGQQFTLCQQPQRWQHFIEQQWMSAWMETVVQSHPHRADYPTFIWQAHYTTLIRYLAQHVQPRPIVLRQPHSQDTSVAVTAIIDLGNTNSCGVLYETGTDYSNPLALCSELVIRDLSCPTNTPASLFSSEMNFCTAPFGDRGLSSLSGRLDAFQWLSPVRIGPEAHRLNGQSHFDLQYQGITSPRRYLWDDNPSRFTWFNAAQAHHADFSAIDHPFSLLLDDYGTLLSELPLAERIPMFIPQFSRATLFAFLLTELFNQIAIQINSQRYRQRHSAADEPRYLRRVIFTLPVNFTQLEKQRFEQLARQALILLQTTQPDFFPITAHDIEMVFPWDEACCGQIVWLWQQLREYSVTALIARYHRHPKTNHLRVGLIDVGGGTTDLAITEFRCLHPQDVGTLALSPRVLLRQGFTLAGDSVLEDVINYFLFPQLICHLKQQGLSSVETHLERLFSRDKSDEGDSTWRQYIVRHLFLPVVHDILARYQLAEERYFCRVNRLTGDDCMYFIESTLREKMSSFTSGNAYFELSQWCIEFSFGTLTEFLESDECRLSQLLRIISDTVTDNQCDVMLLSGQVMALAVFQHPFKQPSLHTCLLTELPIHSGLPFCAQGKLDNGKHVTSVGALLYALVDEQYLLEQSIISGNIGTTAPERWYGPIQKEGYLQQVLLSPPYQGILHTQQIITGPISMGYRCSSHPRAIASPLFTLIPNRRVITSLALGVTVELAWHFDEKGELMSLPSVISLKDHQQQPLNSENLSVVMNTLSYKGNNQESYWRDDGCVMRSIT
ncbi:hypothetical protein HGT73_03585 [Rosenbergiella australiborealis]|uniref:Virulence factor SrfB n=2 Tax=Rosenbergiella TaxID=1356488 RepID=A0ABS5T2A8_9GAMM|nr:virulence factor SrfB [Rosenbergiella australiborealis]MBT0726471.1 hypothetical protein [Rosenbergiella australiborealis]